jgi:uncharacterized protein affecting Mg2+/Co2+ transport
MGDLEVEPGGNMEICISTCGGPEKDASHFSMEVQIWNKSEVSEEWKYRYWSVFADTLRPVPVAGIGHNLVEK